MSADLARQLKIKTGTTKRTYKELLSYRKEIVDQGAKVEKMRADGADKHDIKQQEGVLSEAHMMIPDTTGRLERAIEDLEAIIAECSADETIKASEEFTVAETLLKETKADCNPAAED